MKISKLVLGTALLMLALPFSTFAKSGTISTTRTGTISTTRTGTISTTTAGTISTTRTSTISTTRTPVQVVGNFYFEKTEVIELFVTLLNAW